MNSDISFKITSEEEFERTALKLFQKQFIENSVYREFCSHLNIKSQKVKTLKDIPFLPIQFFKTHEVKTGNFSPELTFLSSGTTGQVQSQHHVKRLSLYEESFTQAFEYFYGNIEDYVILGLLPSYLEREGSSLIYMVDDFIQKSNFKESGFYLNELDQLSEALIRLDKSGHKILLIGVSFALLDLVEKKSFQLRNTIVMETGGMKGRRKEMIRKELHDVLSKGFGVKHIHSEYGMTELLSQAYSKGESKFECPPHMKILIRDTEDPFHYLENGKTGGINVIDLANVDSCAFIATQDLGKQVNNQAFEILGRFDQSDIRGCNLLIL
ncbi:LuxE/PaaK family acyltransferase [Psychroflexus montanilacus]|uniref:LuxE/PaaK family acyltransferase n=1 Tax=Psychroflexus montanilacus TaxID=2873598 RepID=UPI001CCF85E7|nr:acyl transferase [Psychroflexus montanilacus]MBZ9652435.1 acyl transferase [Psychroflexus montanilacus]